jgi:hypothetical protein
LRRNALRLNRPAFRLNGYKISLSGQKSFAICANEVYKKLQIAQIFTFQLRKLQKKPPKQTQQVKNLRNAQHFFFLLRKSIFPP